MRGRGATRKGPVAGARFWMRSGRLVLARPGLWPTALAQSTRLARPRWWRRPPFLPLPDREYLRFRFETQYGAAVAPVAPVAADLVDYLEWCRATDVGGRRARRARDATRRGAERYPGP